MESRAKRGSRVFNREASSTSDSSTGGSQGVIEGQKPANVKNNLPERRNEVEDEMSVASRLLQSKVMKYWFLLEKETAKAIAKGNLQWVNLAMARITFLKEVIPREWLLEGLNGEEEALVKIQTFLYNEGWWVKANNLNLKEMGMQG